jgi:hypothetical protein
VILAACAPAAAPDPGLPRRATGLAQTAAVVLTAAAVPPATDTPVPPTRTPTPEPTVTSTEFVPSPTPTPSPTPCTNGAQFILDLSVPDGTHLAPGTPFIKTWRLLNSGTCTWTTDYEFRHILGDPMGSRTMKLANDVPPGARLDLSITLFAPATPGSYMSRWQIFTPQGEGFGIRPYVEIIVP